LNVINCIQGSSEWRSLRLGKITGTRLGDAFKGSEALKNTLIAERMATYVPETISSRAMQRGNELEPFARKLYEKRTGWTVEEVGFITHPTRPDFGLSPDGIISLGCMNVTAVEIKCPASKTHIQYMRQNTVPQEYVFQLSAYFLNIPNLHTIDFVSYDELNEVRPIHILTLKLEDILNAEYGKGKTIGSIGNLESKAFAFADSVEAEYQRLIF